MKLIVALAAISFALTSVAANAARDCVKRDHAPMSKSVFSVAGAPDCHEIAGFGAAEKSGRCDIAAFCALFCGVVPPPGAGSTPAESSISILFHAEINPLTGVIRRPEAPPPRASIH
jgi:hypothetical protein